MLVLPEKSYACVMNAPDAGAEHKDASSRIRPNPSFIAAGRAQAVPAPVLCHWLSEGPGEL